jgi:hypothetical protein
MYVQRPDITSPGLIAATMHVTTGQTVVLSAGKSEVYGQKVFIKGQLRNLASGAVARTRTVTRFAVVAHCFCSLSWAITITAMAAAHNASVAAWTAEMQAA